MLYHYHLFQNKIVNTTLRHYEKTITVKSTYTKRTTENEKRAKLNQKEKDNSSSCERFVLVTKPEKKSITKSPIAQVIVDILHFK